MLRKYWCHNFLSKAYKGECFLNGCIENNMLKTTYLKMFSKLPDPYDNVFLESFKRIHSEANHVENLCFRWFSITYNFSLFTDFVNKIGGTNYRYAV